MRSVRSARRIKWGFNFVAASGLDKCIPIVHAMEREGPGRGGVRAELSRGEGERTDSRGRGPPLLSSPPARRLKSGQRRRRFIRPGQFLLQRESKRTYRLTPLVCRYYF